MSDEPRHALTSASRSGDGHQGRTNGEERPQNSGRSTASVQISVPGGIQSICPQCGATSAGHDVTLGLAIGPVAEGTRLFLVESDSELEEVLEKVRRVMVGSALRRTSGNIARAAQHLGVKYTTLYSIVRRLGLDDPSLGLTRRRNRGQPESLSGDEPAPDEAPDEARGPGSGGAPGPADALQEERPDPVSDGGDGGIEPGSDAPPSDRA